MQGVTTDPTFEMALLGIPLLLLVTGLWTMLRADRTRALVAQLLVGGGAVSLVLVSKHLVRPQGELVLIAPLIALLFATLMLWSPRRLVVAVACGSFLGMVVYTVQQQKAVTRYWDSATNAPERMVDSARFATNRSQQINKSAARFKVESYPNWTVEPAMAAALQAVRNASPDKSFAVVGDAQALYFLLDQPPPYQAQLYNASPENEQKAMIEALEREDRALP